MADTPLMLTDSAGMGGSIAVPPTLTPDENLYPIVVNINKNLEALTTYQRAQFSSLVEGIQDILEAITTTSKASTDYFGYVRKKDAEDKLMNQGIAASLASLTKISQDQKDALLRSYQQSKLQADYLNLAFERLQQTLEMQSGPEAWRASNKSQANANDRNALSDFATGMAFKSPALTYLLQKTQGITPEYMQNVRNREAQDLKYKAYAETLNPGIGAVNYSTMAQARQTANENYASSLLNIGGAYRAEAESSGETGNEDLFTQAFGQSDATDTDVAKLPAPYAAGFLYLGHFLKKMTGEENGSVLKSAPTSEGFNFPGIPGGLGGNLLGLLKGLSTIGGIVMSVSDALQGLGLAPGWGVSGVAGAVGAGLGGTGSGVEGMLHGMIKGGLMGFGLGGPAGLAIGLLAGGIFGFTGGETLAQGIQGWADLLTGKTPVKNVTEGLGKMSAADWLYALSLHLVNIPGRTAETGYVPPAPGGGKAAAPALPKKHSGGVVGLPTAHGGTVVGALDEEATLLKRGEVVQPAEIAPLYKEIADSTRTSAALQQSMVAIISDMQNSLQSLKDSAEKISNGTGQPAPTLLSSSRGKT